MVKTKEEVIAIREKKSRQIESALRNSVIALKKMGITSVKVTSDESGSTGYIIFDVGDLVKLIQSKCKQAVKKVAGKSLEVVAYIEENTMVVRVRK